LAATVAVYALARWIHDRLGSWWSAPLIVAPLVLIALVLAARIPFPVYYRDTRWLLWLLGPATVAFAVPIYEHRNLIRHQALPLASGVACSVLLGLATSAALARLFHLDPTLTRSLLTRSVSTPFALAAATSLGGNPDLAALFVILTGLAGMVLGEGVLLLPSLRSALARGAMFGGSAHVVGSARARKEGSEEGAVASLTMILAGIVLVLVAPLVGKL
jgi:putative effector of murein hydrolase